MIIITSTIQTPPEYFAPAIEQARKHVAASRLEEGCLSHQYFVDPEHEHTIVFLERWRDQAAIDHHFGEPTSRELVENFQAWCPGSLELEFHHVESSHQLSV
ncbi:MAG: antibiotic biosynthesis monooxygenase [Deltaproteobacteria bacterium]|nr:antibiotic biosynthesis monooxygenase [Deltaproteobacteria bacterium]